MLGIGLKLLGIGKAIINWILGIVKAFFDFCAKHPLMAFFIALDIILVYGCWWGYKQHVESNSRGVEIVQLKQTIKEKDSLIEQLYNRTNEYVEALREAQKRNVETIKRNNAAVENLKSEADDQLERAQREAARTKAQRDQYFQLAERYRHALNQGGTPEERIAREEKINDQFIRDYRGVR